MAHTFSHVSVSIKFITIGQAGEAKQRSKGIMEFCCKLSGISLTFQIVFEKSSF